MKIVRVKLGKKFEINGNRTVIITQKGKNTQETDEIVNINLSSRDGQRRNNEIPLHDIDFSSEEYRNMTPEEKQKVLDAKAEHIFRIRSVSNNDNGNNLSEGSNNFSIAYNNNNSAEISVYSDEYKKLSDEEKLEVVRRKLTNLFKYKGNNLFFVSYYGETKGIDREKYGTYKDLLQREKALKKSIEAKNNKSLCVVKNNALDIVPPLPTIGLGTIIKLKLTNIINKIKNIKLFSKKNTKKRKIKSLLPLTMFSNIKIRCINSIKKKKDMVINKFNSFKDKVMKKQNANRRLPDKKRNIRQRITAGICALTIVMSGFMLSKCNKNSNSNISSTKESTSQSNNTSNNSTVSDNNDVEDSKEENPIIDDNNKEEIMDNNNNDEEIIDNNKDNNTNADDEYKEDKNQEENNLSFSDTVTINTNSYIYTNSYDATYNTNSYNPYYAGHYERDVQGLVYELNGNIYMVYENDVNALQKQKELEDNGAVITAVLVTRNDLTYTGEYEGYYNINSVKVKTK